MAIERRTGYKRSLFPGWLDTDGDGCNTRWEVLIAESIDPVTVGDRCRLSGGRWLSLYDGVGTRDATRLGIDHVVALAEAWDSGASAWPADRRARFSNDLDVDWTLVAVSIPVNDRKSDQDPTDWLPPFLGARCTYLSMWIAVKVRWQLAVDPAEKASLESGITGCSERMDVPVAPR